MVMIGGAVFFQVHSLVQWLTRCDLISGENVLSSSSVLFVQLPPIYQTGVTCLC